jgi:uncharacterized repeat protein (TIGR01451 family)
MYLKKLGAAMAMCVLIVGVTALPAFAHHPTLTGSIVCNEQSATYDVTWTVSNGNWENRTMTLDQSNRSVVPLSSYAPDESKSYSESLPGTTSGVTTLTVRGDWDNGGPQNVVGSASVESAGTCRTPPRPAITVTKDCPQSALVGEEITYTIRVTDSGDEDLEGITVQDSILGDLSNSFANTAHAGDSEQHTFSYTVGAYPDPLVNVVTVSGSGVSSEKVVRSEATCQTDVLPPEPKEPQIGIVKQADDGSVDAGDDIGYTVTVSNTGDGTAEHVELTDELPGDEGLDWAIAGTSGGWDCEISAGTLTCGGQGFDLDPGDDASVHITSPTTPDTCGKVKNQAEVEWDDDDGQPAQVLTHPTGDSRDDLETELIKIEVECQPEIGIVKQADDGSVDAGDDIGYTVTVSNTGDGTAEDVELSDALPDDEGLDWAIASTSGGWDCEIDAGTLSCGGGGFALDPGEDASVHITSPTTPDTCGKVKNRAKAEWEADDDEGHGEDEVKSEIAKIEVECTPAIQVVKDGPDVVHRGDTITYDFEVTNVGELDLFDVELTDPICDQGTIALVDDGDGDPVLAIDEVWRFTCTHLVTDDDPDPLPNTATVRGDADEGEGQDDVTDTDDHSVDILHPAIAIVKTVSERIVKIGDTVTYTYVVRNTGDTTLYDIRVDDDILGHIGDIQLLEPGMSASLTKDFVVGNEPVTNVAIVTGEDVLGHSVTADDAVTVTPIAGATPPATPFTGSDTAGLGLITVVLLGIGVTVVASTRKRRPERETA